MARCRAPGTEGTSGAHLHQSLLSDGDNAFAGADGGLSEAGRHYLGGMLATLPELQVIFRPTVNSFRRANQEEWSPVEASWGHDTRTSAIRAITVPAPDAVRFEHRVAGADVNPHLVVAACLAGGLHGIEQRIEPSDPGPGAPLVTTLPEAIAAFERVRVRPRAAGRRAAPPLRRQPPRRVGGLPGLARLPHHRLRVRALLRGALMTTLDPARFDHNADATRTHAAELFRGLREQCPVFHSDQWDGFWGVTRHETLRAVGRDPGTFGSAAGVMVPPMPGVQPLIPLESDGERHATYRELLLPHMGPAAIRALDPLVRATARELLGATRPARRGRAVRGLRQARADDDHHRAAGLRPRAGAVGVDGRADLRAARRGRRRRGRRGGRGAARVLREGRRRAARAAS